MNLLERDREIRAVLACVEKMWGGRRWCCEIREIPFTLLVTCAHGRHGTDWRWLNEHGLRSQQQTCASHPIIAPLFGAAVLPGVAGVGHDFRYVRFSCHDKCAMRNFCQRPSLFKMARCLLTLTYSSLSTLDFSREQQEVVPTPSDSLPLHILRFSVGRC